MSNETVVGTSRIFPDPRGTTLSGRSFPGRPKQPLQWIATAVAVAAVVGLHALVVDQFSACVRRKLAA
ncbi:hypothetical protein [Arthrobacter sp. efr-133-TYG-118]|uniref:hypothetical protein n=1 Tax=Arthrobacter sp. efr-133-TYG-118 TaxID=3040279 RepID=UPI00254C1CF9|nr:hypothetical protein [Arthrobacter sp. efr-133-TYG-118]